VIDGTGHVGDTATTGALVLHLWPPRLDCDGHRFTTRLPGAAIVAIPNRAATSPTST